MNSASGIPGAEGRVGPAVLPAVVTAGLAAVAATGLLFVDLPGWLLAALALACLGGGALAADRLARPRWRRIGCDGQGVRLYGPNGRVRTGRLLGRPFVSPFYVGFLWRDDASGRPGAIGLFRGQLDDRVHRRLSVLLRHGSGD